jgi:thiol:disulfide interchange protein DsbD
VPGVEAVALLKIAKELHMRLSHRLLVPVAVAVLALAPTARPVLAAPVSPGQKAVSVKPVEAVRLVPRGSAEVRLTVTVAEGYHVQANPAAADYLIPTRLQLRASPGLKAGRPVYPKGREYRLVGSDEKLSTYDGTFEIVVPLKASAVAAPGERVVRATLKFQACDDKACYAPATLPVEIPVRVEAAK